MILSLIVSKFNEWLRYREIVAELSRLSDRDLEDVGISRFDIATVARKHAKV